MKILLADDERELTNALAAILKHNNYSVDVVYNGTDAYDYGDCGNYDCIILDIMMPGMSGIEVLKKLREAGNTTPVLLLTAKSDTDDKISGLDCGADDYITKPCPSGELLARIRAATRRRGEVTQNTLCYGDLTLNRTGYELSCKDVSLRLAGKEYQMLEMLMLDPNRVIPTESFMDRIWGYESEAGINVVWVYISYIRKKLTTIGSTVKIKASRGLGYSLML